MLKLNFKLCCLRLMLVIISHEPIFDFDRQVTVARGNTRAIESTQSTWKFRNSEHA